MNKVFIFLFVLLAVGLTVGAVSADDDWSFNFGSSESTNSNGGAFVFGDNQKLNIQQLDFTIPDGFKENESARIVGVEANNSAFPGFKATEGQFIKGNDQIIVKVFFGDKKLDDDEYSPDANAVKKEIGDTDGYYKTYEDGVSFDFVEDGKLVEIYASNDDILTSVMKSFDD